MFSLAFVSFIAGILTILAPCVLPVLPVILAGSLGEKGKWYPYVVTLSLASSIVLFTIILKVSTFLIAVPPTFWTYLSGGILLFLGLAYIFPHAWTRISDTIFGSRANISLDRAQNIESSTLRGIVTGAVLGPVFSTCSPTYSLLLATVFPVSFISGVFYMILYALGLGWMVLIIARFGNALVKKLRIYADEKGLFRKVLGLILASIGLVILLGFDKKIEAYSLEKFDVSIIEQGVLDRFFPPVQQQSFTLSATRIGSTVQKDPNAPKMSLDTPVPAPEIPALLTEWINSNPLTIASLKGKVVLIDFWTYSCINCQRTLPYIVAWDKKYRDKGLVVIGVHAPEFAFEHEKKNVERAVQDANITYPVVLDNDYNLWNAYDNRYWPAKYFIDKNGNLRHYHFGEGQYAESEKIIQYLLSEGINSSLSEESTVPVFDSPSSSFGQSPETYLGSNRRDNFVSGMQNTTAKDLNSNEWSLDKNWDVTDEFIVSRAIAHLDYDFSARDVYLVLGGSGAIQVKIDGKSISDTGLAGKDVKNNIITVDNDRMYHIVHGTGFMRSKRLELEFSSGIRAYAFTFGG